MNGIGSISALTSMAAQPMTSAVAASVDVSPAGAGSGVESGGSAASGNFAADYAMSLLAKVTHASADQALTLIQSMLPPAGEALR
jgi:hypothetical protein